MNIAKFSEVLGLQLLFLIGGTTLIGAASLLFNVGILGIYFLISLTLSILYGFYVIYKGESENKLKLSILVNLIFIFFVFLSLFISGKFYDISYDGQSYHQEAVISLKEGWNPIYDEELQGEIWINHYAKGTWFFSASLYDLIGQIEYSKASNILLLISVASLVFSLLLELKIKMIWSIVIMVLAALNPITINQLFSFYIDGQLSSLFLILIILFIKNHYNSNKTINVSLAITLFLLINIKFTALGYALVICGLPFFLQFLDLIIKRERFSNIIRSFVKNKAILPIISGLLIGVFVIGASSYISNTIDHRHPFYPLAGEGKVDIMTNNTPVAIRDSLLIKQLYLSIFSKSSNDKEIEEINAKIPFSVSMSELSAFRAPDVRIGGFGPLFGLMLLVTLIGFIIWIKLFKNRKKWYFLALYLLILISVVINVESWWARYVPQLWLIPLIFMVFLATSKESQFKNIYLTLLYTIGICNLCLIIISYVDHNIIASKNLEVQLNALAEYSQNNAVYVEFNNFESNRIRIEESGINYKENQLDSCENPMDLQYSSNQTRICISNPELFNEIQIKYNN